ncbi:DUF2141 domain-containing protein [Caulobacter endophyticus]|uniref:DUF2141 domain-containing protein n=1 Tax=Caulobacter endophyticus TaxID=2172652 RepID=UPI00240F6611|nr:DUF2141 domain-containing protein [Caulobacter endophyticus]MDG2528347.1 DUF2141 domain-containing protein [Caulobacter endophyticus]
MRLLPLLACAALLAAPAAGLCQDIPVIDAPPAAPAAPAAPADASLTLTFPALKAHTGALQVAVYDSAQAWKGGKAVASASVPAAEPQPTIRLDLPAGTYAVRVYHDVDGDGRLGTNAFGIPAEPYGFSNDAKVGMGPPPFEAAAFTVAPGENAHAVTLR